MLQKEFEKQQKLSRGTARELGYTDLKSGFKNFVYEHYVIYMIITFLLYKTQNRLSLVSRPHPLTRKRVWLTIGYAESAVSILK